MVGQSKRRGGVVREHAVLSAAEGRERLVQRVDALHQLRLVLEHTDRAVTLRREALAPATAPALIKVEERQPEPLQPHSRARLRVDKPQQQRHVVELLAAVVLWSVEVDLRKLAVQPVPDRLPRTVEGRVRHLHVERAACGAVEADVAIQQRWWQRRVEAAEVRLLDGGAGAKAEERIGGLEGYAGWLRRPCRRWRR